MLLSFYPEKENYEDTCRVWNTLGCFKAVPQLCSVHVAYANDRNSVVTLSTHPTGSWLRTRPLAGPPLNRVKDNKIAHFLLLTFSWTSVFTQIKPVLVGD